jgi:hypothetical protein
MLEYIYAFSLPGRDNHPFLAYHWHPSVPDIPYPHLHVGIMSMESSPLTPRTHVPTGLVALEQVLRLAITQFGVQPLRDDWARILDETQALHEEYRAW